jgi:endonuclease/exonuclease/phosphatase family metal-dependent hydrolase
MNPEATGFTCPAAAPAGRIDFIFASPELAQSLECCYIPTEGEGVRGEEASDHLPVVAEFGEAVEAEHTAQMSGHPEEVGV